MEKHFEQTGASKPNPLESQSEKVSIEFGENGQSQKFVEMKGGDDKGTYVASYPGDTFHMNMVVKAAKEFEGKGKKVYGSGGGFLIKQGETLTVYGESAQVGKFNKEKVVQALQEAYPGLSVIAEE